MVRDFIPFCNLVLYSDAGIGEGCEEPTHEQLDTFPARRKSRGTRIVDHVISSVKLISKLLQQLEIPWSERSKLAADNGLVLFDGGDTFLRRLGTGRECNGGRSGANSRQECPPGTRSKSRMLLFSFLALLPLFCANSISRPKITTSSLL